MLSAGIGVRMAVAVALVAALWLAVIWAIA
jgi:hypothetical protein